MIGLNANVLSDGKLTHTQSRHKVVHATQRLKTTLIPPYLHSAFTFAFTFGLRTSGILALRYVTGGREQSKGMRCAGRLTCVVQLPPAAWPGRAGRGWAGRGHYCGVVRPPAGRKVAVYNYGAGDLDLGGWRIEGHFRDFERNGRAGK